MSDGTKRATHSFWETRFYAFLWPEHSQESSGLKQFVYQLRDGQQSRIDSGVAPAAKSAEGLYESDFDILDRDHDGLRKLRSFICSCVQQAVSHVNGAEQPPERIDIHMSDSWYHITNDGGFHDAHVHGNCSWCGIYYLQAGSSGQRQGSSAPNGGNRFYSPLWQGGGHEDYGNSYLRRAYIDPPIADGTVLLFPSYLLHSGLPYRGDQDRIVISFNTTSTLKGAGG